MVSRVGPACPSLLYGQKSQSGFGDCFVRIGAALLRNGTVG